MNDACCFLDVLLAYHYRCVLSWDLSSATVSASILRVRRAPPSRLQLFGSHAVATEGDAGWPLGAGLS